jgi:glycosyltransferase involved in cell wall biosynthesis
MPQPLRISVVLSAKNAAADVMPSLQSAIAALGPDDEIVAIDDGSSDETHALMQKTLAGVPHQLLRTPGVGLTAALRLGSEAARGDLIARLDAGDSMSPERLEIQRHEFATNPRLVVCGTNVRFVDAERRVLDRSAFPHTHLGIRACLLSLSNPFVHSTLCMRASAVHAAGGYRDFFRYAQDFDLLLRLSRIGRMRNVQDLLGDSLVSPSGISARRAVEQYTFARIAWETHVAALLGVRHDLPVVADEPSAWQRLRMRTLRRLHDGAAVARQRGNLTRARVLETTLVCSTPVTAVVGATVRSAEFLSTVVSSSRPCGET